MTASTPSPTPQGIDWRVRLGVGATAVWLVLGALYVGGVVGWTDFVRYRAPELGEFLDGAFAPLAFLLQQRQLEDDTAMLSQQLEVMRQTAAQASASRRW
jgi:hypothetical protein